MNPIFGHLVVPMESVRGALIDQYTRILSSDEMRRGTRETMNAVLLALQDNAPERPRDRVPMRDLARRAVYLGYKTGELILVGSAAMRLVGQDPNGSPAVLGTLPNGYLTSIGRLRGNRGDVMTLVNLHEAACVRLHVTIEIPGIVEEAYFTWLANEWGAIPLAQSSDPCWLRVLVGMAALPESVLDELRRLRAERG